MEPSISDLRAAGWYFHVYSNFNKTSGDPDQTPRTAASDLVLNCFPTYHKKDAKLIWVSSRAFYVFIF